MITTGLQSCLWANRRLAGVRVTGMMPLPTRVAEQLAAERRADLMARAETHAVVAALRQRRMPGVVLRSAVRRWPEQVVAVRPITAADGPALRREFEQLSARSRMQ